jgi:hypothetical protein
MMNVKTYASFASSAARRKLNFKMINIAGKHNLSGKTILALFREFAEKMIKSDFILVHNIDIVDYRIIPNKILLKKTIAL